MKADSRLPSLVIQKGIINFANEDFLNLTGFESQEIIGLRHGDFFKVHLRSGILEDKRHCRQEYESYLFTKQLEYKEVEVAWESREAEDKAVLEIREKPFSRIEDRMMFANKLLEDDKIGMAIYRLPELILIKANRAYLEAVGQNTDSSKAAYGRSLSDIVPDFEGSRAEAMWLDLIKRNESLYLDELKGGVRVFLGKYYDNILTPIQADGEVKYIVSMLTEVTERVQNIERLRSQAEEINTKNNQLEAILENMTDGVYVSDKERKFIMINAEARKQLYQPDTINAFGEALKTTSYCDLEGKELTQEEMPAFRALNGERVRNFRMLAKRPDKDIYLEANTVPTYNNAGEIENIISCTRDITAAVENEKAIKHQKEQLEAIIENISDGILVIDKVGRYILINRTMKELMLNKTDVGSLGEHVGQTLEQGQKYLDEKGNEIPLKYLPPFRALQGERLEKQHLTLVKGREKTHAEVSAIPIYGANGELEFGIITIHDITKSIEKDREIKKQQELLLRKEIQKNAALKKTIEKNKTITRLEEHIMMRDKLVTAVAHDIRSPLSMLITLIELLEEENDSIGDGSSNIIGNVRAQIINTYFMVENLLEWFSRQIKAPECNPETLQLSEAIKDVMEIIKLKARTKNIQIKVSLEEEISVRVDKGMLELVLRNLLSNAIKFTFPGGRVSIEANIAGEKAIIAVSDNGIGIEAERASAIMNEENSGSTQGTDSEKGMGLGLVLCRDFIKRNGGDLWLVSVPGVGSTFYFSVPVHTE